MRGVAAFVDMDVQGFEAVFDPFADDEQFVDIAFDPDPEDSGMMKIGEAINVGGSNFEFGNIFDELLEHGDELVF